MSTRTSTNEKPDYRVAWLSLIGVAGFLFGCIVLFYPDFNINKDRINKSVFHEVVYQPRNLAKQAVEKLIKDINKSIEEKNVRINQYTDSIKCRPK